MGFFFKKKEKQEQDKKRKENQIGLETKHDTNTKTNTECTDYIKRCCQELEEAGYGSLKIQEFMREVENYQDVEKIEMAKKCENKKYRKR